MYAPKHTKFRIEVEHRLRAPITAYLPPFAIMDLAALAKGRDEHPQQTASQILMERLYPSPKRRRWLLARWRREAWDRRGRIRREWAA